MRIVQVVGRTNRHVIDVLRLVGPAHLIDVAIEPLEFSEELRIREVAVDDADGIIGIQGGHQPVAGVLDGFHVTRGDIAGGADQGEVLHVSRLGGIKKIGESGRLALSHGIDDAADGLLVQIRMHRQTHDAFSHGIAHRQRNAVVRHGGLPIQGNGVMHGGRDAGSLQRSLHSIAPIDLHGVLRPGADVVSLDDRGGLDPGVMEPPGVGVRHALAGDDFLVQHG